MKVYATASPNIPLEKQGWKLEKTAIALGGFDAIHLGHQRIIETMVQLAKEKNLTPVVYLFQNQPKAFLQGIEGKYVQTMEQRLACLEGLGVSVVVAEWFTRDYAEISPQTFVEDYLKKWLGAEVVVAGFNYRFGHAGEGNIATLSDLAEPLGIEVQEIPCVTYQDAPISSSRIRQFLDQGELEQVTACMGRPFSVYGRVIEGAHIGHKLGFPTANMAFLEEQALPGYGVYLTKVRIGTTWYPAITNVGNQPTVGRDCPCMESHILNFDENLYGMELELCFYSKLREIQKFNTPQQLQEQLEQDRKAATDYFSMKTIK